MELKSASREEVSANDAYLQLKNYMQAIPNLFRFNTFSIISDMIITLAGTITADKDRYMQWKSSDGKTEEERTYIFDILYKGMFQKQNLLNLIQNFVIFLENEARGDGKDSKILSAYHQYYAVNKAVESTQKAVQTDGKAGVFWHTQGSGKSLSMVFYAGMLTTALNNPTLLLITDRNDLDDQLFSTFSKATNHLRQVPIQAKSRAHLKQLLEGREAGGIIFTTLQKFEESTESLTDRKNVVVIADEAHRSHYGLGAKVDIKSGRIKYGMAKHVRDALPNASFIGFTGTPIDSADRSTKEIFGNYIDIYDMTQAVEDGVTVPIYYESRVVNLKLKKDILNKIDKAYNDMATKAEPYNIARSKQELGNMESILGADETIKELVNDVLQHYDDRKHILAGKALLVAYSRPIAMKIYKRLIEVCPSIKDQLAIVMTTSNQDPEDWYKIVGNKEQRKETARKFKDPTSELKICIVVDMWLTGFDVPSLNTMYIYKPMKGHTLMQAIARVNRVFGEKEGGLIVDYIGIAGALRQAMMDFTKRDQDNYMNNDIAESAFPKFLEQLEICRDLMHPTDYQKFFSGNDLNRANAIIIGMDHIIQDDARKKSYLKEAKALNKAESLCRSLLTINQKLESAYFEAVRAGVTKVVGKGKLSLKEINDTINELLKASIHSEGVINLFKDSPEFSLFDPKYLDSIKRMPQKNLAAELLQKLLNDQIKVFKRTNLVKAEKFSDRMQELLQRYRNGLITHAEVIDELIDMANSIIEEENSEGEMGLTKEEIAFYSAITKPENIHDFYENDVLIEMTHELTEMLRKNQTIDWQLKEQAQAKMRSMIKRLLKRYGYPPDEVPDAINIVLAQAKNTADSLL